MFVTLDERAVSLQLASPDAVDQFRIGARLRPHMGLIGRVYHNSPSMRAPRAFMRQKIPSYGEMSRGKRVESDSSSIAIDAIDAKLWIADIGVRRRPSRVVI